MPAPTQGAGLMEGNKMFTAHCKTCGWERKASGINHALKLEDEHRKKRKQCKEQK